MATESSPKRVLIIKGCREWVLDSASDQTSRFYGMDRCMLRELFCNQYLSIIDKCRHCDTLTDEIAYYRVEDAERNNDDAVRTPVLMCRACQAKSMNRICEHCGVCTLFNIKIPLSERPLCIRMHTIWHQWTIASACSVKAHKGSQSSRCSSCGAYEWQAYDRRRVGLVSTSFAPSKAFLLECGVSHAKWCAVCFTNLDMARCLQCGQVYNETLAHQCAVVADPGCDWSSSDTND